VTAASSDRDGVLVDIEEVAGSWSRRGPLPAQQIPPLRPVWLVQVVYRRSSRNPGCEALAVMVGGHTDGFTQTVSDGIRLIVGRSDHNLHQPLTLLHQAEDRAGYQ